MSGAERRKTSLDFDFSGIGVGLAGLVDSLASRLSDDWAPFLSRGERQAPLVELEVVLRDPETPAPGPYRPKAMSARFRRDSASFEMPEGRADIDGRGRGRVVLKRWSDGREYHTLRNFVRASLAFTLPNRSGALLHAAGLLVREQVFLLVGPEGSGKSTWVRLGESAGGSVVSDDLVLIDGIGPRLEAVGAPFRSDYRGPMIRGRWPVAAVLFPVHGRRPAWTPVAPMVARARLSANLPFVAERLGRDARIAPLVERLAGEPACAELTFARDAAFVDLLRRPPRG